MVAVRYREPLSGDRYSLLIADREKELRDELDGLFRTEGYETHLAADDTEAVSIVRCERIDVVILEFELPHAGGLDVFRTMKELLGMWMPCVFTAGRVSPRVQLEALVEEAFTVVPKPVDLPMIKRVIRSVIRRYYPPAEADS